jgi:hypothetical protein
MPDFVQPSRLGQAYSGSFGADADALFLKVFSGEIITTFEKYNQMMPLHRVRTIQSGKSATFPVTGVASAKYHVPGESVLSEASGTALYGSTTGGATFTGSASTFDSGISPTSKYLSRFKHNEKVIFIDDVLVSSTFVADIDEMKNHYDVRSIYSTEIGRALAYTADKNLIRTVIAGARKSTDRFGGSTASDGYLGAQVGIGSTPSGNTIVQGLYTVAQKMDEANVPSEERFCLLTPATYYKLIQDQANNLSLNRDYGNEGNGSIASGEIFEVAGIKIMKTNHLPTANESSTQDTLHGASGVKNDVNGTADAGYSGLNYSTTRGIVFHREAVGTVKLMDLSLESDYIMERLGTLMLAKYAMGHNVLREECCYELIATA